MTTLLADQLDGEWVELVMEAKELGLNIEEVRQFIQNTSCVTPPSLLEEQTI
ncbi:anti-repressor SinI family protein [Fictibacillus iocasae]|uniref:Anti-repressor SinI family protein n=1 Tax=Fictibacillus iocasae TaxID=2715437 RepID=A0ABW2NS38_9BACL